jgi:hypothetical protein
MSDASRSLERLHIDIADPMPVISAGDSRFFITVLDDFSKFKAVKPIRRKSEASVFVKHVIDDHPELEGDYWIQDAINSPRPS